MPSEYTVKMAAMLYLTTTPGLEGVSYTIVALLTNNWLFFFQKSNTPNPKPLTLTTVKIL